MTSDPSVEKIQPGTLVEVKIRGRCHTFLMVDDDEAEEGQQLSINSPLGRQLLGRRLAENFHCRLWDGKITPVQIENIEKAV